MKFSLVSCFDATRGPLWDGPRNFESLSDNRGRHLNWHPLQTSTSHQRYSRQIYVYQIHRYGGSSVELGFEPGATGLRSTDLPLRHRGPNVLSEVLGMY
ncbi:hypothetical protein AVEN_8146-1 [Araneus ventricosus]|uniref:Uncharacterized protein n=1 Tax=Araneus ventricosus TaxID=182803 RepID=A0A4Y2Q3X2_ARAVE|nr:hypothetical protein AVEN_8146-1 [Araneus ventricosus]